MSERANDPPIVRISSLGIAVNHVGHGKGDRTTPTRFTVYGVDADGNERVSVEHGSEQEHAERRASDPLWRAAQHALFDRLLANPSTRDTVLQITIASALEHGDTETAATLARHLSPKRFAELFEEGNDTESDRSRPVPTGMPGSGSGRVMVAGDRTRTPANTARG